jgi:adenylate cyclase
MRVARETERKLAAILSADVAGYSRLMGEDEEGTHRTLAAHRRVTDGLIAAHRGRIVDTAGDSILAEFPSAVEAVACAVAIQRDLEAANAQLPAARQMRFRIGINLGDVIVDGDDLFGEGVNIAARLQAIAEPGGICISANVREQVRGKLSLTYGALGRKKVKNIALPVEAYAVMAEVPSRAAGRRGPPRTVALGAAVLCAGAVALVLLTLWQPAGDAFFRGPAPGASPTAAPAAEPMVAVLPFANRSGDSA